MSSIEYSSWAHEMKSSTKEISTFVAPSMTQQCFGVFFSELNTQYWIEQLVECYFERLPSRIADGSTRIRCYPHFR